VQFATNICHIKFYTKMMAKAGSLQQNDDFLSNYKNVTLPGTGNSSGRAKNTIGLADYKCKNTSTKLDPFTRCMLCVEQEVLTQSQIDQWDADIVPIPYSVKIINNTYYIEAPQHLVSDGPDLA